MPAFLLAKKALYVDPSSSIHLPLVMHASPQPDVTCTRSTALGQSVAPSFVMEPVQRVDNSTGPIFHTELLMMGPAAAGLGIWTCTATNRVGTSGIRFELLVMETPVFQSATSAVYVNRKQGLHLPAPTGCRGRPRAPCHLLT